MKVRVGLTQGTVEASIHLAIDKGYYKAEGLDVQENVTRTVTEALPQLGGGNLDFAAAPADPALYNAFARGVEVKVVSYLAIGAPDAKGLAIMVRKDLADSGRYKDAKDMKGMQVALPNASGTSGLWMEKALKTGGLTLKDVDITNMAYQDMNVALANKKVDVAMEVQPFVVQAEDQGIAKTIFVAGELNYGGPSELLMLAPEFAKNQPEAARRFVLGTVRAQRELYNIFQKGIGSKDEVYLAETQHTPIKDPKQVELLTRIAGAFNGIPINGEMPLARMYEYEDFFLRSGSLKDVIDMTKLVDGSYAQWAVQQLGGPVDNPNLPKPPTDLPVPK